MLHHMTLWDRPFACIRSGQKDVELRLHDEKRQTIRPGDEIEFTNSQTGQILWALVVNKTVYPNFAQLYMQYDKLRLGYVPEETADPKDMECFYSPEEIARFGAVAIEIRLSGNSAKKA